MAKIDLCRKSRVSIGAIALCTLFGVHSAFAQTEVPVAVMFPNMVDDLFTAVSYNPRFRIGGLYVGGESGVATVGSPSVLVASLPGVSKIAAFGGASQRSGVFMLNARSNSVHVYDPGFTGAPPMSGPNQIIKDMWKNRYKSQLMTLDIGPTLENAAQRRGAFVLVWSTDTRDTISGFQIRKSINSFDYPLCPCDVAADPNDFGEMYAIARSDTVTAHRFVNNGTASATGQIVVPSPAGSPQLLGQIIADRYRAYVTDSQGRLHTVTMIGGDPQFAGEAMTLSTDLTRFTIVGTLTRDTALGSPYFFEVGSGPNLPPGSPSVIKVFAGGAGGPSFVTSIPTSTNSLGPFTYTPLEIFFWDGTALKAMRRGSWQVRNIPGVPVDGAGSPVHYDDFDNVLRIPIPGRKVVAVVDPGKPSPVAPNDLSGDSRSDIVFNDAAGAAGAVLINGVTVVGSAGILPAGSGWSVTHVADFDNDGRADLLIKNADGRIAILLMDGTTVLAFNQLVGAGAGYTPVLNGDFNRDGRADILLKNSDGSTALLLMDGVTVLSASFVLTAGSAWNVTHAADFNADGHSDLVIRNDDGSSAILIMRDGMVISAGLLVSPASPWRVTHAVDLNGDGKADVIIKNSNGSAAILLMDGITVTDAAFLLNAGSAYTVTHTGDFNGDGNADLLLRNTDGSVALLRMNGTTVSAATFLLLAGSTTTVAQVADYNGDGKSDILLRNANGSATAILMNGGTVTAAGAVWGPGTQVAVP
jgi:FG-GAP-like repeat